MRILLALLVAPFICASCTGGGACTESEAYNKMLALSKVSGRLIAKTGDTGNSLALRLSSESGAISELIAQKKLAEACAKADQVEKTLGLDLKGEEKDMVTFEELQKDGGKGSGTCSIADAAKKQMEVHGLLQAEVNAGKRDSSIFREFADDTKGLSEMYSTDPSAACKLMEELRKKYGL